MDEKTREAGLRLLAKLEARDVAEINARAVGWVVISTDLEFGTHYIMGPFDEPAAALEYEQKHKIEMEDFVAEGRKGWAISVLPLMPPS